MSEIKPGCRSTRSFAVASLPQNWGERHGPGSRADQGGALGEASIGNLELAARQIVLFPNGFKDEAPEKKRPDYWGAYNPRNGEPIVRIGVWAKKDRNQHAMLGGATARP